MRPFAIALSLFFLSSVLASCGGGSTSPPVLRDYRGGGTSPGHVTPQSLCYYNGKTYSCGGPHAIDNGTCTYKTNCSFTPPGFTTGSTAEDLSNVTDPAVVCGFIGYAFNSTYHFCWEDNSPDPSYAWHGVFWTYAQCDWLANGANSFKYDSTLGAYVLQCAAPSGGTGYWNVAAKVSWNGTNSQDLGVIQKALPSSRLFTHIYKIYAQSIFDDAVTFAQSDSSGNTLGPFGYRGGGIAVGW